MWGVQGGLLQWVLRLEHLSQFAGHLPPAMLAGDASSTALECDGTGGVFIGGSDGSVWHLQVCGASQPQHESAFTISIQDKVTIALEDF